MQPQSFSQFHVTGITTDGKRFKRIYSGKDYFYAFGINLWRGSVWGVDIAGNRKLLKRVFNY
jgi:hypothetical protein